MSIKGVPPVLILDDLFLPDDWTTTAEATGGASYDPSIQGAISSIDTSESGIILSFPFPDAFTTTQPVVSQGGRTYRSTKFIRFIAQNSSHAWETKSLSD